MEGRVALWTMVGIVVFFKLGTAVVILLNARPSPTDSYTYGVLFAHHWFLLPIVVILAAGNIAFWYRLLRARAQRKRLQRSEWEVKAASFAFPAQPGDDGLPPGSRRTPSW